MHFKSPMALQQLCERASVSSLGMNQGTRRQGPFIPFHTDMGDQRPVPPESAIGMGMLRAFDHASQC